jgi:hypothetical protein
MNAYPSVTRPARCGARAAADTTAA